MEKNTETTSLIPKMTKFGKWVVLILLTFILVWPLSAGLYWTIYKAYAFLDPTRFPGLDQNMVALLKKTTPDSDQRCGPFGCVEKPPGAGDELNFWLVRQ